MNCLEHCHFPGNSDRKVKNQSGLLLSKAITVLRISLGNVFGASPLAFSLLASNSPEEIN